MNSSSQLKTRNNTLNADKRLFITDHWNGLPFEHNHHENLFDGPLGGAQPFQSLTFEIKMHNLSPWPTNRDADKLSLEISRLNSQINIYKALSTIISKHLMPNKETNRSKPPFNNYATLPRDRLIPNLVPPWTKQPLLE